MDCKNCGNTKAYAWRMTSDKHLGRTESCDRCGNVSGNIYVPDVYWDGPGTHPSLVDKNNKPIFFATRREKAQLMKEQNAREAGDWHHGTRGTEGLYVPRRTIRPEVQKLKKIFQDHERRTYGR